MIAMSKTNYTYRNDHIPKGTACNRRPGLPLAATTITIHNTGNPTSTATNERRWLTNSTNGRQASYHIVVDAKEAIEVLPLNEVAWHAGDGSKPTSGNMTSIGIEICERDSKLGEYAQTLTNAVDLVAKLLHERGWGVDRLRRHYDWSGKQCPRLMNLDGKWSGWYQFVQRVQKVLKTYNKLQVKVVVNGKQLVEPGMLMDNRTYVPLRVIAKALGAQIGWDQQSKEASIDGVVIDGMVMSGTTYVPLRLLGEEIGAKVKWDPASYTAILNR
jgi:N-acetylmuramoyl-L-alanine amidase